MGGRWEEGGGGGREGCAGLGDEGRGGGRNGKRKGGDIMLTK